jgi:DNA-binding transcriptional ArsR family regulator
VRRARVGVRARCQVDLEGAVVDELDLRLHAEALAVGSPLVGTTQAGLSKHLRMLSGAGILDTRREGYYVLYSLRPERVAPLSTALLAFLGREDT